MTKLETITAGAIGVLDAAQVHAVHSGANPCALEDDAFPLEFVSELADTESWRKEVYRPTAHIHKWWARRLGSVFRAVVLGALLPVSVFLRQ